MHAHTLKPTERIFDLSTSLTILYTILVFGFLIFIHEFGHFIFARIFGVTVNEFSIGMGPRLFSHTSKKSGTRYSVAVLPFGGFVAMNGENEDSEDPGAFCNKPAWQRFIISAAGALINLIFGFIVLIILAATMKLLPTTTVHSFYDKEQTGYEISTAESGLMAGDTIVSIDGKRVRFADELSYEVMRRGHEPVDVVVLRDGQEVLLANFVFPTVTEQGQTFGMTDFVVYGTEPTVGSVLGYGIRKATLTVRMCWESLFDLITGRYTIAAVSGPVGISAAIGTAAGNGFASLMYLVVMISINLGVMNLLPIPALDGGRLVTLLIEMITRKRLPEKVEGTINAVALMLLLGFSVFILIKDIFAYIV